MRFTFAKSAPRRLARGFTLIELMVGTVVASIVILGVAASFVGINSAYQSEAKIRSAVENSRNGLAYLERVTRLAGYGIEPQHAFDFKTDNLTNLGTTKKNYAGGTTDYFTDDLAIRYRDPAYMRRGLLASDGLKISLSGSAKFGVAIRKGQPMIVGCPGGGKYVVVKANEAKGSDDTEVATVLYGAPFSSTVEACATTGVGEFAPYVFLMYDLRIRVMKYGGQPYLVAFNSLADPTATTTEFVPIAVGVENFQVAYIMNRPPPTGGCCATKDAPDKAAGNDNWILGDHASDPLPNLTDTPGYDTPYDDAKRYNGNLSNIRALRLTLVVRNASAFANLRYPRTAVEDWGVVASVPNPDGHYRTTVTTTVPLPNMKSRSFFLPPLKPAGNTTDLNVGGG